MVDSRRAICPPLNRQPIAERFGHVVAAHIGALREVGDGARDAKDSVIAARGQAKAVGGEVQQGPPFGVRGGDLLQQAALGVGVQDGLGMVFETRMLDRARRDDPRCDLG